MIGLAHRENAGFYPDLLAWLEGPFVEARPVAAQTMRMEEYVANGRYVVRAELPGPHVGPPRCCLPKTRLLATPP